LPGSPRGRLDRSVTVAERLPAASFATRASGPTLTDLVLSAPQSPFVLAGPADGGDLSGATMASLAFVLFIRSDPRLSEWLLLIISLLLIAASGAFVAAEFAFLAVDRNAVDRAAGDGDRSSIGVQKALRSLSTQLSGAQVGITITNLGIGFLAEPAIAQLVDGPLESVGVPTAWVRPIAVGLGLAIGTLLTMIFGELVPKNLALARPFAIARATQGFQRTFTSVMAWPILLLNGSANSVVRRLGIEPQEELRSARSSTELASLIQRSADLGTLDAETAELVERSVEFGARTAGEIMTPRVRTAFLDEGDRAIRVIELARETGHSRFPVLDGDDVVVGTVHVKHAVALTVPERTTTRVKHIMARPTVVPDSLRLDPLLTLLRRDGFQMAIVLDEYGGQAGIVTLEDVVEEIVGDISDEHDPDPSRARMLRDGSWILSGLLRPDEVEDMTKVQLPEDEDYDTIAGLVLKSLGRIPRVGDVAEVAVQITGGFEDHDDAGAATTHASLRVTRMDSLRVDRIAMAILPRRSAERSDG
jgi:CBS domain containing-hemolysin-like protein